MNERTKEVVALLSSLQADAVALAHRLAMIENDLCEIGEDDAGNEAARLGSDVENVAQEIGAIKHDVAND